MRVAGGPSRTSEKGRRTCSSALTLRMASEQRLGQVSPLGRMASDTMWAPGSSACSARLMPRMDRAVSCALRTVQLPTRSARHGGAL